MCVTPGWAQVTEQPLDEEKWKELTDDLTYRHDSLSAQQFQAPRGTQIHSGFVKYLLIGAVIALLIFLVLRFVTPDLFKSRLSRKPVSKATPVEAMTRDELDDALREALHDRNWRLALRIYYLIVIRELASKRFITWHLDKTNNQYLREMSGHPLAQTFRSSTRTYERVWFGEEAVDAQRFDMLEGEFKVLIDSIQRK
jgi:hypothetical protein